MNSRRWFRVALTLWVAALFIGAIWMAGEALAQDRITTGRFTDDPPGTVRYVLLFDNVLHKDGFEGDTQ